MPVKRYSPTGILDLVILQISNLLIGDENRINFIR
jgi:hypothetical protein